MANPAAPTAEPPTAETQIDIDQAMDQFFAGDWQFFNDYLDAVPAKVRKPTMLAFLDRSLDRFGSDSSLIIGRRIAQHPNFACYWQEIPSKWNQGLFYIQAPFLKTRASISLMDHPKLPRPHVDYSVNVLNQQGKLIKQFHKTIHVQQTHTFALSELVPPSDEIEIGIISIESAETDLHSLRSYACWYNEHGITTTHEKMALGHGMGLILVPSILASERLETYMALSNVQSEPLELKCQLMNTKREWHPQTIQLRLEDRHSCFFNLSQYFNNLEAFLADQPGILYLWKQAGQGMYYYFIHNKEQQTWQIQHL